MQLFLWAGIIYFVFLLSYILNTLISELPLDDRYVKLRTHFTISRFLSLLYYPVLYLFKLSHRRMPLFLRLRHFFVFILSFILILMYLLGYTNLNPVIHFIVFSMLIICFFTDLEHEIIPNEISFGLILVGFLNSFFYDTFLDSLKGALLVCIIFLLFSFVVYLFVRTGAFGAGDIKLCIGIATVWGWKVSVISLYFTFLFSGFFGLYFMLIKKRKKDDYYAFAPVIIIGLFVALIYTDNIFDYYYPWVNNSFEIINN